MDFTVSLRIEDFSARIADFIATEVLPPEADRGSYDAHENIRLDLADTLRGKARAAGLWCLQLKPETGGQGVGRVAMAVCYEETNRSIFRPVVFNSAAPDDGDRGCGHSRAEAPLARADRRRQSPAVLRDKGVT